MNEFQMEIQARMESAALSLAQARDEGDDYLAQIRLVDVHGAGRLVLPACLQLLEAVLGHLVIGLAGGVVVGRHVCQPFAESGGGAAAGG